MTSCSDVHCRHYHMTDDPGLYIRVCTKRDPCPLEIGRALPSLAYRLCRVKESLRRDECNVWAIASQMRDWPEVYMVNLDKLAWAISKDGYAHANDVKGLIELFEERWKERMS